MDSDLATQMVSARSTGLQNAIQTTLVKKAHEADMAVVEMISQATSRAPAPQGQGIQVDKLA